MSAKSIITSDLFLLKVFTMKTFVQSIVPTWVSKFALLIILSAVYTTTVGCNQSTRSRPLTDAQVEGDVLALDDAGPGDAEIATDASESPWVKILDPEDGSTVSNPVTFEIAAFGVTTVELAVDGWSLGPQWDPSLTNTLTYNFDGTGFEREVVLSGYDADSNTLAEDIIYITVENDDIGDYLGSMKTTYYYKANEEDYPGTADTTLYDSSCNPLAYVSAAFSDAVCIEGSGILKDGRIINYATSCSCGRTCPTGGIVCYMELDPVEYPWGMGSFSNPLVPFRSLAVDNSLISPATKMYVLQWDGVSIPEVDGIGGFVHDGCFRADDVGGWIQGYHFDFFAGTRNMWQALEGIYPTNTYFDVYINPGKCD